MKGTEAGCEVQVQYLGVAFTSDKRQDEELDTRTAKARRAWYYLVLIEQESPKKAKLSIFKTVFVPIPIYSIVINLG